MSDKILKEALSRFEDAEEGWNENRKEALDDLRFARLGEQWPEDIAQQREDEGRPCLTINKLPAYIRKVVNEARANTPRIKVHPATDGDEETANVINGIIRNIETVSNADQAYDTAIDGAVSNGFGYFRIDIEYSEDDSFELDIEINTISNPLSVYPDPNSTALDASDWNYCFIVEDLSDDVFEASYPNADKINWESKGDSKGWITEDTVRVAEYWKREEIETTLLLLSDGTVIHKDKYEEEQALFDVAKTTISKTRPCKTHKVTQFIMNGAEVLETNDWPGTLIPISPCYGDVIVVEEKRYFQSLVRQAKDPQRNFNYWRSSATEKIALGTKSPWIGPKGFADSNMRKWETANTETHAFLEYDGPIAPQQTQPSMADAGSITEALSASDDLKTVMGLQDASMGIAGNEVSGKAILARKSEGDVSTYHYVDNRSRAITYGGKVILEIIPHVYNTPRIMKVLGYDDEPDSVQINQKFEVNGMLRLHDLTKGKYDLVVNTGPSSVTQREEAANFMIEAGRADPRIYEVAGDLIMKYLDVEGSDEISKRLKVLLPPEIQAMEKLDGLPPEAQAAIAQSQQQVQQMSEFIEQGKQLLQQKDEEIKGLQLEKKSKQDELFIKEEDSKRKFTADMAKIEQDARTAEQKETEENRRMIISEATGFLQDYINQSNQDNTQVIQDHKESMSGMMQGFDVFTEALQQLNAKVEGLDSEIKTIEIKAPSGGVYKGVVDGDDIEIKAPSGAIYTGNVTQH